MQMPKRMRGIIKILKHTYPDARCSLNYKTPYQLLVATILSAQCTDERVNKVTPILFAKFGDPERMSKASYAEIEKLIRSTGFFKNKARALKDSALTLVKQFNGELPNKIDELVKLRGVGRKTANVVLGNAFNTPGMVVDTHVGRLSRRMGFTNSFDPERIEQDLMAVTPKKEWTMLSHLFIFHGRACCTSRKAYCEKCVINSLCMKKLGEVYDS